MRRSCLALAYSFLCDVLILFGVVSDIYEKYDKEGNFLKHGITKYEDPAKRYTAKQIGGGTVVRTDRGPRSEMIKKERDLVERSPGPDNLEPWAGKRLGK